MRTGTVPLTYSSTYKEIDEDLFGLCPACFAKDLLLDGFLVLCTYSCTWEIFFGSVGNQTPFSSHNFIKVPK